MKNKNDYLVDNSTRLDIKNISEDFLKESDITPYNSMGVQGIVEADSVDDTGWEEPASYFGAENPEE